MKRLWFGVCGLSVLLAAEPACHIIYTTIKHHHSKKTVAGWEEWAKLNPNWKPRPMPLSEVLDYACGPVEPVPEEITFILPMEPPILIDEMVSENNYVVPPPIPVPPGPPQTETYPLQYGNFTTPVVYGGGSPPVPEIPTFLLVLTGLAVLIRFSWSVCEE